MIVFVGSSVTKKANPPSEHGVVTDVGTQTVTVRWHLKEAESRGLAGTKMGTLYEDPKELIPDTPSPFCKL
jgi:hypothetical protein